MNKAERKQLVNKQTGWPYIIETDDSGSKQIFVIRDRADERMFVKYASNARNWVIRNTVLDSLKLS